MEICTTITDEDADQNRSFGSVSSNGTPLQIFTAANKSPNSSFICASYFYCKEKEEKRWRIK
jgi:hypothetical protein